MQKIFITLIIMPMFIYASYNPFFTDIQAQKPIEPSVKVIIQKQKPEIKRTDIKINYFGFIESNKGKFALVKINGKNIVLKQKDSVYIGEKVVKVLTLSSNFIILKDGYNSPQTIYFSSRTPEYNNQERNNNVK
ncbi:hypothetical protein [Candidatus Sulfurimonas baltica]|uniref:Uncharacterized protein n=1 Tax=Candidatus Sulfurimonas baltica TaxID=2740404 RepID=A0A7S7LTJ8_9BACT|nr:hypothetical protein [Candidatus Sulfurimonas baltica]QOY51287.1 hypothetical protein HUE88_09125 [Candidatus Sulfurimonas baltica]